MPNKILLDTSPLLLFLIGSFDKNQLSKIKYRDTPFDKVDYDLLADYLKSCQIFVTPQILAEMSNIAKKSLKNSLFQRFMEKIAHLIKNRVLEIYMPKDKILTIEGTFKYGFSDISLYCAANHAKTIVTADLPFHKFCVSSNKNVEFLDTILAPKWHMKR